MTVSPTPNRRAILPDLPALQLSEQVRSLARMVVRRLQQHASACRLSLRHTSASPCQGDMPHQFAELVAGGFEIHLPARSVVALPRGKQWRV